MSHEQNYHSKKEITLPNASKETEKTPVIHDLASIDFGLLLAMDPIPPVLIELVTLLAVIAADTDWKAFCEAERSSMLDAKGKEGVDD